MKFYKMVAVSGAVALLAAGVQAATYVEETWDTDESGWLAVDIGSPTTTLSQGTLGGQAALIINTSGSVVQDIAYIYDTPGNASSPILLGVNNNLTDYDFGAPENNHQVSYITFDFYANSGNANPSPGALALYFVSSGGTMWRYVVYDAFAPQMIQDWNSYSVSLWLEGGWDQAAGSQTFRTAMQDVAEIGIEITYTGTAGEQYGLDNFTLHYPEPGTYAVLAFALLSLGVTFRGKLREGLQSLRRQV